MLASWKGSCVCVQLGEVSNYGLYCEFHSTEMHSSGLSGMREDAADQGGKAWQLGAKFLGLKCRGLKHELCPSEFQAA